MTNKILLLTYHPLTATNGGTIMYKSIIEKLGENELYWIGTGAKNSEIPEWLRKYNCKIFPSVIFRPLWLKIFMKPPFYFIHFVLLYYLYVPYVTWKIETILKEQNIQLLWIEGVKQTFKIGEALSKKTGIPIHLSMNDDISVANSNVFERNKFIVKSFTYLLFQARTLDFISEGMVNYYKSKYGFTKSNFMILWVGNNISKMPDPILKKKISKIVFFGSIHGFETINFFCQALVALNNHKHEIILDIYSGTDYSFLSKKYKNVFFKGELPTNKLKLAIQNYDLVYVPYPFNLKQKVLAITSMASKMILAMQCQIPILAHGPAYASNIQFVKKSLIGICVTSIDPIEIASNVLAISYEERKLASENAKKTYLNNYDSEKNIPLFIEFLRSSSQY